MTKEKYMEFKILLRGICFSEVFISEVNKKYKEKYLKIELFIFLTTDFNFIRIIDFLQW